MSGKLADQSNWVQRVLGVTLTAPARKAGANGAAPGWQAARQAWPG